MAGRDRRSCIEFFIGPPVGRAVARLNLCLLCNLERVVDLDAEIADCALQLGVTQQELHGSQVEPQLADPSLQDPRVLTFAEVR